MCLYGQAKATKKLFNRHKGFKICWKILQLKFGLRSPYYDTIYKPGINRSNSEAKLIGRNIKINHGIHVYLKKIEAINNKCLGDEIIVRVLCLKEDLIATDGNEAVYRKVYLSQKTYKNALKG